MQNSDELNQQLPIDKDALCLCGCGKLLGEGKSHKKYYNDAHRIAHHNDLKKENFEDIKPIDTALKKNQKILKKLVGDEKYAIVTEGVLQSMGYNFKYSTHSFISSQNNNFTVCYNYGYRKLDNGKFKLIRESEKGSLA